MRVPSPPPPLHVPRSVGHAALAELDRVPWGRLAHAYGVGRSGEGLHHDVAATLRGLGDDDPEMFEDAANTVFSNLCHQGTIYEATPFAVPFLAAFAAGVDLADEQVASFVAMFVLIGVAATYDAPDGSHSGSFGPGVGAAVLAAFRESEAHLSAMGVRNPGLAPVARAVSAVAAHEPPDADAVRTLQSLLP
ncbi:MAG: hypothetical protein KC657_19110 [Myxococcales bacterium]|nr:hypothetical protein [Myxococcales bacterium]